MEVGRKMQRWAVVHVCRDANEATHHLAHWAAAEISLGGISYSCEHSLDLSWVFAGIEPP